jgi:chloride channel 7
MNPRATMKIYPRPDNYFKKKHSLDFDMMRTKVMLQRKGSGFDGTMLWVSHIMCGVMMGFLAFMLTFCEDEITKWRAHTTQKLIDRNDGSLGASYTFYIFSSMILVFFASMLTVFVAPAATGSGVAEVMGLLNGVNYTDAISFKTLLVKCLGTLFAVCGGLCIGKEGPLVHIGANIGVMCCFAPMLLSRYMQNDVVKRQMMACGASCGVSVAFGAPIGGALFSYEISKPNTFWTFSMLWRVFTATSVATFTLSLLQTLITGSPLSLSDSGALKFGHVTDENENTMLDLPAAIIIGVITGLLGALFIRVSLSTGMYRKQYVNNSFKKVLECVIFAFMTASTFYGVVVWRQNNCRPKDEIANEEEFRFTCQDGDYNPLATLIFNTEGGTIRQFFKYPELISNSDGP